MNLEKNTPIFFQELPQTEETRPNAVYLRFKGSLPNDEAHEIRKGDEVWTVSRRDILTVHEGLAKTAERFQAEIAEAKKLWHSTNNIAQAMGISETTLRKRMKLVQNHLTKPHSAPNTAAPHQPQSP